MVSMPTKPLWYSTSKVWGLLSRAPPTPERFIGSQGVAWSNAPFQLYHWVLVLLEPRPLAGNV